MLCEDTPHYQSTPSRVSEIRRDIRCQPAVLLFEAVHADTCSGAVYSHRGKDKGGGNSRRAAYLLECEALRGDRLSDQGSPSSPGSCSYFSGSRVCDTLRGVVQSMLIEPKGEAAQTSAYSCGVPVDEVLANKGVTLCHLCSSGASTEAGGEAHPTQYSGTTESNEQVVTRTCQICGTEVLKTACPTHSGDVQQKYRRVLSFVSGRRSEKKGYFRFMFANLSRTLVDVQTSCTEGTCYMGLTTLLLTEASA